MRRHLQPQVQEVQASALLLLRPVDDVGVPFLLAAPPLATVSSADKGLHWHTLKLPDALPLQLSSFLLCSDAPELAIPEDLQDIVPAQQAGAKGKGKAAADGKGALQWAESSL